MTAPTLFEGSTETSNAYAATAASPVTDAITLQRKIDSGGGILEAQTRMVVLLDRASAMAEAIAEPQPAPGVFYDGPTIRRYFPTTITVR
jgi:hypothetical protein